MPPREEFVGGVEEWRVTANASNGAATATKAAETGQKHYVTGFSASVSGTVAASVVLAIRQNGGATVRREFQIPNAAIAPVIYEFKRVLEVPVGLDVDITLPALGAGITGRVELLGFTRLA